MISNYWDVGLRFWIVGVSEYESIHHQDIVVASHCEAYNPVGLQSRRTQSK
jgi:hypothetical protein